jgi:hypothetical protein
MRRKFDVDHSLCVGLVCGSSVIALTEDVVAQLHDGDASRLRHIVIVGVAGLCAKCGAADRRADLL